MNMTVTYRFKSLADVAEYFERRAGERREAIEFSEKNAKALGKTKVQIAHDRGEVAGFEQAAGILRKSFVGEP